MSFLKPWEALSQAGPLSVVWPRISTPSLLVPGRGLVSLRYVVCEFENGLRSCTDACLPSRSLACSAKSLFASLVTALPSSVASCGITCACRWASRSKPSKASWQLHQAPLALLQLALQDVAHRVVHQLMHFFRELRQDWAWNQFCVVV